MEKSMRIAIIIAVDIMIIAIALFTASEIFALKRFKTFTVPYTEKLISLKILRKEDRESVLREDRISHMVGMGISSVACIMMSCFLSGISGILVFAATIAAALFLIHADMEESPATREGYFRMHKTKMNPQRYAEFLANIEKGE
jgi:hypothetical protein